jgi:integrase
MAIGWLETADNLTDLTRSATRRRAVSSSRPRGGSLPCRSSAMPWKRKGKWYAKWTENGRRRFKSCPTKDDAAQLQAARRQTEWRIEQGLAKREDVNYADRQYRTIDEASAAWQDHMNRRAKRGDITQPYADERVRASKFAAAIIGAGFIADLSEDAIRDLQADLVKADRSTSTIKLYVGAIRELRRFAIDGPRAKIARTAPKRTSRVLTPDEARILIANPVRGWIYLTMLVTGLRWNEAMRIRWSMLDLDRARLILPKFIRKTKRACMIPLASILVDQLRSRQTAVGDVPVFPPLPRRQTWLKDVKRAGIAYNVDGKIADRKCLRTTFTNLLAIAGVDSGIRRLLRGDRGAVMEQCYDDGEVLFPLARLAIAKLAAVLVPAAAAVVGGGA